MSRLSYSKNKKSKEIKNGNLYKRKYAARCNQIKKSPLLQLHKVGMVYQEIVQGFIISLYKILVILF